MSGKESNLEQSYVLLDLAGQVTLRVGVSSPDAHQIMVMIYLLHQIGFRMLLTDLIGKMLIVIVNLDSLPPDIDPSMWGLKAERHMTDAFISGASCQEFCGKYVPSDIFPL